MIVTDAMHDEAGAAYVAAVREFRRARGRLDAIDRHRDRSGFGPQVEVVALRHGRYLPDESGALSDDTAEVTAELNR